MVLILADARLYQVDEMLIQAQNDRRQKVVYSLFLFQKTNAEVVQQ